jgi:LemA protein
LEAVAVAAGSVADSAGSVVAAAVAAEPAAAGETRRLRTDVCVGCGRVGGPEGLPLQDVESAMKVIVRKALLSAALAIVAIGVSGCSYNRFVGQEEAIKAQWAQVENQLQRRNDLIPNLVETVKGYAQQEKDVFGQIADSRSKLAGARTPEDQIKAANDQSAALARLLVISENYPQLRSNESFNRLMDELSGTENRIAVERMRYNERVQEYNTARRRFPANLTASIFGFKEYPLFNAPPEAERVPRVNFGRS